MQVMTASLELSNTAELRDRFNLKLSSYQRMQLRLFGYAKVGVHRDQKNGIRSPIFVAECKRHGIYVDTPHGNPPELRCGRCEKVFLALNH